jgi:hypothetical protein
MTRLLQLCLLSALLLPALALGREPAAARLDPATLSPRRNLLSNCSFEAPATALPAAYATASGDEAFTLAREGALHGQTFLHVAVPAAAAEPVVLTQLVPGCGGCTYALSGWARGQAGAGVQLVLEALDLAQQPLKRQESAPLSAGSGWTPQSVQLRTPPQTEWVRVGVAAAAGVTSDVDALRLSITRGPLRRSYGPHVTDLRAIRTETTWAVIAWAGPAGRYTITYRQTDWPRRQQVTLTDIEGPRHSLIGLDREVTYDLRVRVQWPEHYDEQGRIVTPPILPAESEPLALTTPPWQAREVGLLRIWPFSRLQPVEGELHHPRLEADSDSLYVGVEHGGGITLAKLAPDTLHPAWVKQIVAPPAEGPAPALLDLQMQGATLFVLVRQSATALALLSFSATGEPAEAAAVFEPVKPPGHLRHAALATFHDEPWLLWIESADDSAPGTLHLASLAGGRLGKSYTWGNGASPCLDEASMMSYGDELMIPYTQTCPDPLGSGAPVLGLVSFDGLNFGGLRKLRDMGRSREPRARQFGPNCYLIFTSDASYLGLESRYRDLMLATLPPGRLGLEMVNLLDDRTCNVSPDITALGQSLWTVHEKLEQAPTAAAPTPRSLGVFIGRIEFGPVRRVEPRGSRRETAPIPSALPEPAPTPGPTEPTPEP